MARTNRRTEPLTSGANTVTDSLTLRAIKARPLLLKMQRPVVAKIATIEAWPIILIDLETEEGITGRAYLEPYIPKAMKYLVPALHDLGEMLKGQPVVPMDMYKAARNSLHFVGYGGLSMIAVAGLDMVVWDTVARAANQPLCVMLGGSVGPVPAYSSNGLWLKSPAEIAIEAAQLQAQGEFKALKIRMGRERVSDDIAALEAARQATGDNVDYMVDFNQGLHIGEAMQRCKAIDDLGLLWIEEPIVYENYAGYAQLARDLTTPLQIGENFYGPRDMYKALQQQACDYVMPDFMRIGGITGWMQSAGIAAAADVPMSSHLYPEVAAHVLRASETAHWLEWQDWADPILEMPYHISNGELHIPDKPGLGLDWNEDYVRKVLVS